MTRMARRIVAAALMTLVIGAFASPAVAADSGGRSGSSAAPRRWLGGRGHVLHHGRNGTVDVDVCSQSSSPGVARCDARARADLFGRRTQPDPAGVSSHATDASGHAELGNQGAYDPEYLQSAYNAPVYAGVGQTVAIVDAYDAPNVESDLTQYRSHFGLSACTTANGCFEKINQTGGTTYPASNAGWAAEITLDVQMVSAICPNCHILLVEASTAQFTNLAVAVNTAVAHGADVVSNSYGSDEFASEIGYNASYDHPGVAVVASTGDTGYGVGYPASAPNVVAVGGTSLFQASNDGTRDATETAWTGAGSGCSAYEAKPAWQTDTGCAARSVADVAAVADPGTGVWVYNSADGGWEVFGGTSVSAPIIGAFYALAGDAASGDDVVSYPYAHKTALNDVSSGSNGSCGGTYLCTGLPGYDGPTGLGTPNSAAAFSAAGAVAPPPPPPDGPAPNFTVAVSKPAGPIKPGSSGKSTVKLTPTNGFTGSVQLRVSVSPAAGLVPHLRSTPVAIGGGAFSTSMTLDAVKGGIYKVKVVGTRGPIVHGRTITVYVNDFSMRTAHKTASVVRGKAARYTVTLQAYGSFKGPVKLSTDGLGPRDRVSYSRNPVAASGSVVVTVSTSVNDSPGSLTLRCSGVNGTLKHVIVLTLSIK